METTRGEKRGRDESVEQAATRDRPGDEGLDNGSGCTDAAVASSPLDSLPEDLLFRVLFTLIDDTRSMGRLVSSYKRLSELAVYPAPPADAPPQAAVDAWSGGSAELRRVIMDELIEEEGYPDLAPDLKKRAQKSFSGALRQLHQLREIRSEGPTICAGEIHSTDFTVAPVVLPGTGTILSGASRRVVEGEGSVAQWNVDNGNPEQRIHLEGRADGSRIDVASLAVAGGKIYVGRNGGDGTIQAWNSVSWKRDTEGDLIGHGTGHGGREGAVQALLVLDAKRLMSANPPRGDIKVWNLSTKRCMHTYPLDDRQGKPSIAMSADKKTFACASTDNRRFDIWDVSSSFTYARCRSIGIPEHFDGISALAASASSMAGLPGGVLASASRDKRSREYAVTLWSFSASCLRLGTWSNLPGSDMHISTSLLWCDEMLLVSAGCCFVKMKGLGKLNHCDVDQPLKTTQNESSFKFVPIVNEGEPLQFGLGFDHLALVGGTVIATQTNGGTIYMFE